MARVAAILVCLVIARSVASPPARAQIADLDADDPDVVLLAIEGLGLRSRPGAARALATRIRRGLPQAHLTAAVRALGAIGDPAGAPVLFDLLSHRRASIRRLAVEALAGLRVRGIEAALRDALSDRDRRVRVAALAALDDHAGPASVPTLLAALDRGHVRALAPLSRLVGDDEVPRLLERLGRLPLDALAPVVETLILRGDLGVETRVAVVTAVEDLGTPATRALLESILDALPGRDSGAVRQALRGAIARLPG